MQNASNQFETLVLMDQNSCLQMQTSPSAQVMHLVWCLEHIRRNRCAVY